MKALLIYPKSPPTFWGFNSVLKFLRKKSAFPPLGLLTVAALLPPDWELKLIDLNVEPLTDEDLNWGNLVLISGMIIQENSAQEIITRAKLNNKIIIGGGPLFIDRTTKFPLVDYFVLGEAEITLPLFLHDFLGDGQTKRIYDSDLRPSLNLTPLPRWDLILPQNYVSLSVQFSRGCPYDCEFCDIVLINGRKPRTKSPEQFLAELEALYQIGWRSTIFIVDDNLIGNKIKVKEMLRALIVWQKAKKYPFKFLTEASVDLAQDEELMNLMSQANFFKVFLGIETPNQASLVACGKTQNVGQDLKQAVQTLSEHGLMVMGGFIVGFDDDPPHIFELLKNFIQNAGVVVAMVGPLDALPGTKLYQRLKQAGRINKDSDGDNMSLKINFTPIMGLEKLTEGYKKLITTLYGRQAYYQRVNLFFKHYRPTVKDHSIRFSDLQAFVKSLVLIGILSGERFHYWSLIIRNVWTKRGRSILPLAIELAIIQRHFALVAAGICRAKI